MTVYIDTSALVKTMVVEEHSEALREWLGAAGPHLVASELLLAEARRVAIRRGLPPEFADGFVVDVDLLQLSSELIAEAGTVESAPDTVLGTLDALHLVTALRLVRVGARVDAVLTYDATFAESLRHHGFVVQAPGT